MGSARELVGALKELYELVRHNYGKNVVFRFNCSLNEFTFSVEAGRSEFLEEEVPLPISADIAISSVVCKYVDDGISRVVGAPLMYIDVMYYKAQRFLMVIFGLTYSDSIAFKGMRLNTICLDVTELEGGREGYKEYDVRNVGIDKVVEGMRELFGGELADKYRTIIYNREELIKIIANAVRLIVDSFVMYKLYP